MFKNVKCKQVTTPNKHTREILQEAENKTEAESLVS